MRRSRIKAVATVPVRRKVVQGSAAVEFTNNIDNEDEIKSTESVIVPTQKPIEKHRCSETDREVAIQSESKKNVGSFNNGINVQKQDTVHQFLNEIPQKSVLYPEITCTAEIASPIKAVQGRSCFMRPTPRLDSSGRIRKNSIHGSGASASESEDDSRRTTCVLTNRIRNDSVCSVQNSKEVNINTKQNNISTLKTTQKRRMLVSESARKLAEARREFHLKHENKAPDRSKLTMYDLIYYNPVSNPMKKSNESTMIAKKLLLSQSDELQEAEEEDDPSAMPVPQVKVGPDGQLIIDEQSLVIEQTTARKKRQLLAKEAIVDDDNNGSGFYKRRQKSREWSKWETLKFYKALNTVGTDFLLMKSLFPNRTRQEIKIKFKKEEKINRKLIEKALVYHQEFDTELLEKQLATFEETQQEVSKTEQAKLKQKDIKIKRKNKCCNTKISRIVADSIAEMEISEHHEIQNKSRPPVQESKDSVMSAERTELLSSDYDSGSDEIYKVRPTRSGRLPKVRKLQGPEINTLDNATSYDILECKNMLLTDEERLIKTLNSADSDNESSLAQYPDAIKNAIPDISQVEPGSLVILSKESSEEPGKTVLQVYMASSNIRPGDNQIEHNITPVNVSSDLLATVATELCNMEPIISVKNEGE